jgi:plasmid stabilization system protein ParE
VSTIAKLPRRGRVVPELGDEDIRETILGACRLVYEVEVSDHGVAILAVLHGARDFRRVWGAREQPGTE